MVTQANSTLNLRYKGFVIYVPDILGADNFPPLKVCGEIVTADHYYGQRDGGSVPTLQ
jgi:hypothetical protein